MTWFLLGFLACYPVSAAANALAFWWERRRAEKEDPPFFREVDIAGRNIYWGSGPK